MTISYISGIPAGSHNPSADQPNMLTNNDNIATFVAVDHVAFNTSGSGKHNQVTFNSNNVPSVPTSPPVLFTDNPGSAPLNYPQLYFYSGTDVQGENQYTIGTNGSSLQLAGMIVKWGNSSVCGSSQTFASLGLAAFPNNCYSIVVTGTSTLYTGGFVNSAKSASAFTISRTDGSSGATGYDFIAIGN